MTYDPLSSLLGDAFKSPADKVEEVRKKAAEKRLRDEQALRDATPVPPIAGRRFEGDKYVKVSDVISALETTGSAMRVLNTLKKYEAKP